MVLEVDNAMRTPTGAVWLGTPSATLPTEIDSTLTGFTDLGILNEDGLARQLPGAPDREVIRGWQNNMVIVTIRTPNEDNPTYTFTLVESKKEVVEWAYETEIETSAKSGRWVIDAHRERTVIPLVFDVIHGSRVLRQLAPKAIITEVGEQTYNYAGLLTYPITVEIERDDDIDGHIVEWDSKYAVP